MQRPDPPSNGAAVVATAVAAVGSALLAIAAALYAFSFTADLPWTWGTQGGAVVWTAALVAYPATGLLITRRQPGNRIGRLMLGIGLGAGVHQCAVAYAGQGLVRGWPAADLVGWVGNFGWALWIGPIVVVLAPLFPTGRPLGRWWRVPIAIGAAGLAAGVLGEALAGRPLDIDPRFANPVGVDHPLVGVLQTGMFVLPFAVAAGAASLVVRHRRADATGRLQLRWFLAAVVAAVPLFAVAFAAPADVLWVRLVQDATTLMWSAVAVAVGIAVLRYRLYAIDTAINRVLVYTILSSLLALAYFGGVAVLRPLLRPITGSGDLAVAASTLVVAALFQPVRRGVQRAIDRRFARTSYDPELVTGRFGARLRDEMHLEAIIAELEAAVAAATLPTTVGVWLPSRRS